MQVFILLESVYSAFDEIGEFLLIASVIQRQRQRVMRNAHTNKLFWFLLATAHKRKVSLCPTYSVLVQVSYKSRCLHTRVCLFLQVFKVETIGESFSPRVDTAVTTTIIAVLVSYLLLSELFIYPQATAI